MSGTGNYMAEPSNERHPGNPNWFPPPGRRPSGLDFNVTVRGLDLYVVVKDGEVTYACAGDEWNLLGLLTEGDLEKILEEAERMLDE